MDTAPKPFIFVLMPFSKEFNDIYKLGIKAACKNAGAYAEKVDERIFQESILERVYNQISKADIIIAAIYTSLVIRKNGQWRPKFVAQQSTYFSSALRQFSLKFILVIFDSFPMLMGFVKSLRSLHKFHPFIRYHGVRHVPYPH